MSLQRQIGSLGQGLCDCVALARADMLEDNSSTYSWAVGSGGSNKELKPHNCQGNKFLPGTINRGGAGFMASGWERMGSKLLLTSCLRNPGLKLQGPFCDPGPLQSHKLGLEIH